MKQLIATRLAAETPPAHPKLWQALSDKRVIALGLIHLADQSAASGSRFRLRHFWGRSSDVRGERVWHIAIPLLLTGVLVVKARSPALARQQA